MKKPQYTLFLFSFIFISTNLYANPKCDTSHCKRYKAAHKILYAIKYLKAKTPYNLYANQDYILDKNIVDRRYIDFKDGEVVVESFKRYELDSILVNLFANYTYRDTVKRANPYDVKYGWRDNSNEEKQQIIRNFNQLVKEDNQCYLKLK